MATASIVALDPGQRPVFAVPNLTKVSADKVSELLQQDLTKHHVFFNDRGFHVCQFAIFAKARKTWLTV